MAFSFAAGSLSSILSWIDTKNIALKEKLDLLEEIKTKYCVNPIFYEELKHAIKYEIDQDNSSIINLMDVLPHRLRVDLAVNIYQEIIENISFF